MRRRSHFCLAFVLLLIFSVTGCAWNPTARKQKFLRSGQKFAEQGKYREASIQFLNAIQLDPVFAPAHYELAKAALRLGDTDSAFYEFQQTVQLAPENLDAQVQYGYLQLVRGNIDEARKAADLVVQKQDENADGHLLMTQVMLMQKDIDGALRQLERATQLAGNRPDPYLVQARIKLATGKLDEAEQSYQTALQRDPKNLDAMLGLATLYQGERKWSDAERYLRIAIQTDEHDPQPRMSLAFLYLSQDLKQQAFEVAAEAKKQIPENPNAYRMPGNAYIWAGDPDKALVEYADIVKTHRQDNQAKKTYVQLLILVNRIDEAETLNGEVLAQMGSDAEALIEKGEILIKRGKSDDAVVPLKEALRNDPDNYLAHYYLGLALNILGDFQGATREWKEAARLQPRRVEPQIALARIARAKDDLQLLGSTSEHLLKIAPNSAIAYIVRARADLAGGNVAAAEKSLQKATELQPHDPTAYELLAELRISQKRFSEAEALLEQSLDQDQNYYRSMQVLSTMYVGNGETAKALKRLSAQIARAPNNSHYYLLIGAMEIGQKDFGNAEQSLRKALSLDPQSTEAYRLLANISVEKKDPGGAIRWYEEWAHNVPVDDRPYVLLGELTEAQGDWQSALDSYRKALDRNSHNGIAANNMAYSMLEHGGDTKAALSYALLARKVDPGSPVPVDTLGWAYYHTGDYRLAADVLQDALAKNPQSPTIHYHLGRSFQKLKQWAKAREHYEKALQLDPKSARAAEIQRAIQETQNQQGGAGQQT